MNLIMQKQPVKESLDAKTYLFKLISLKVFEDLKQQNENELNKKQSTVGFCETLFEFDLAFVY